MERLSIVRAAEGERWQRIVDGASRHDFYHRADYHRLAESRGEGRARLFVYRDGGEFVALPLLLRSIGSPADGAELGQDATSVYGYAGPVSSAAEPSAELLDAFRRALAAELSRRRLVSVFSRLHPLLAHQPWLDTVGECVAAGATVSIDLTLSAHDRQRRYRQNHRRDLRRLERAGLRCEPDPGWTGRDDFERLYLETMERVGADPSYLFDPDYFDALTRCSGARLFLCRDGDRVACAGLFLVCAGWIGYHLSGTAEEDVGRAPLKLLLDAVAQWGHRQGARRLHLGGGLGGRDDALMHFKRGFSKDEHPFHLWKWVLDRERYDELSRLGGSGQETAYFPAYRRPGRRPDASTDGAR